MIENNKIDQIVSKIGARAMEFVFEAKPSDLIPFSGNLPIVPNYLRDKFEEEVMNKMYISDCSDWVQSAIYKGNDIYNMHYDFLNYLKKSGIGEDNFKEMNNSDKATELIRFLNANSMSLEYLQID